MNIQQIRTRQRGEQFEEMGNNQKRNMPKVVIANNQPQTRLLAQDVPKEDKIREVLFMIVMILALVYGLCRFLLGFI